MKKTLVAVCLFVAGSLWAARPVARWDVVPYQMVDGVFKIGVVAFHEAGVKVVFTVNGRKVWTAKRASRNDRTGVVEHVFPFDAAKYKDGPVVIGATAETEGETSYKLPELTLYANAGKTLGSTAVIWADARNGNEFSAGTKTAPVKSIKRAVQKAGDGGTVYLLPGTYEMKLIGGGQNRQYWTRVQPAPGVAPGEVKIEGGRSGTEKLLFKDVELFCDAGEGENRAIALGENGATMAWFDNCTFYNKGGRASGVSRPFGNKLRAFVTGGLTRDMGCGPSGELVRGHEIRAIARDVFSGGDFLAVNVKVADVDPEGAAGVESDLYQGFALAPKWVEDVILYNVVAQDCRSCGLTGRQMRNVAFVNVGFQYTGEDGLMSKFADGLENAVFARVRLANQGWEWTKTSSGAGDVKAKDVRLFDVKVASFTGNESPDGVTVSPDCDIICFPKGEK